MRYHVFHYEGDRLRSFSAAAYREDWPGPRYRHVGDVEAVSLDEAFALTQHLSAPWTDGPAVRLVPSDRARLDAVRAVTPDANSSMVLAIRSTSVGDVFVTEAGLAYGVDSFGFEILGPVGEGVRARIEKLRTAVRDAVLSGADGYTAITALQDWSADWRGGREVIFGGGVTA